jgi:hypothetical protein
VLELLELLPDELPFAGVPQLALLAMLLLDRFIALLLDERCAEVVLPRVQLPTEAWGVALAARLLLLLLLLRLSVAALEPALPCANAVAGKSVMAAATNIGLNFMTISVIEDESTNCASQRCWSSKKATLPFSF